ncbi:[FeFe] hydrogenase, group A [Anaerovoracaceae bacterium 41-7]|uniref:[FeFe] hydrogenase, group A n=1 Tax=Senimuribacter intestinalis TaxID=2941507 RepID=UPI00203DE31B|nr:[FeFe] hydrogenase, group A [Senimuribacter intestinalis]
MGFMTINNRKVEFTDEKNVLTVIRNAGIDIPTFCYHSELSTHGACRLCVVEDDKGKVFASCSERPRDGMKIFTHTRKIQHHRKMVIELLLAAHCRDCTTCAANGVCDLQNLANRLGVTDIRFENYREQYPMDTTSPCVVRDANKCILCGDCVRMCHEVEGVGVLGFTNRGSNMLMTTPFMRDLNETNCVGCGQCRVVCPTGAITIKSDTEPVWQLLEDKNVRVVAQIAPAVRVAVGEAFGMEKGVNALGHLAAAMRYIGFEEVYDTDFGADLTVIEEAGEFVERLKSGENLPLFTSCCPAWVKFCEDKYPQFAKHISTCRSPQQMFGALIKEEARMKKAEDSRRTVVVSIMPCTAKKGEIIRPEHFTDGEQNVDYVLTTTEIASMIKSTGINMAEITPEALDMPFGMSSGAGAIFGNTGGVTEAVLRYLTKSSRPEELDEIKFSGVRGNDAIKEATVSLDGKDVRIAIINGLGNASKILDEMEAGNVKYDFIEVMTCPGGCVNGGGQPVSNGQETTNSAARQAGLYRFDSRSQIKSSDQNPVALSLYDGILKGREHKLLHNEK